MSQRRHSVGMFAAAARSMDYIGSASSDSDETVYTFAAQGLGAPHFARDIIVALNSRATGARTVSSVTVGGISASIIGDAAINSGGGNTSMSAFYWCRIPAGTAADVVVTFSNGMSRASISIVRSLLYDLAAPTDHETSTSAAPAVNIDVENEGVVLATGLSVNTATATWTNLDELVDSSFSGESAFSTAMREFPSATPGHAATLTWTSSSSPVMKAIAVAPI